MELRKCLDTEPNPSHTDQPSMKSSPTVPKQDYNLTPSYPKTPPNSPQIENSHPPHCGNTRASSSNQETTFKVPEVLSTLEEPGEGREECQNGVTTSTEQVSAIKHSYTSRTACGHLPSAGTASNRQHLRCSIIRT